MVHVVDHLWQGSGNDAWREKLEAHGIRFVLNVSYDANYALWGSPDQPVLLQFPIVDGPPIPERYLRGGLAFLEAAREAPTLVHCMVGVSRSAAFALAYLREWHCRTVDEALARLKAVAPHADPKPELLASVKRYFGEEG